MRASTLPLSCAHAMIHKNITHKNNVIIIVRIVSEFQKGYSPSECLTKMRLLVVSFFPSAKHYRHGAVTVVLGASDSGFFMSCASSSKENPLEVCLRRKTTACTSCDSSFMFGCDSSCWFGCMQ